MRDLADFDPFDPDQQGTHHDVMGHLRDRCPVARLRSGMVVLSQFDDVRAALSDRTMRNAHAARAPEVFVPPEDRLMFFEYDPPEHTALRRLLLDLLSRERAARQAPFIRQVVEELLGGLLAAGGGDLVERLSVPLSGQMMMRLAGFPVDDAAAWRHWIRDMVVTGFSFTNRNERGVGFADCYPDVLDYLDAHLAARAAELRPGDKLLLGLASANRDDTAYPDAGAFRLDRTDAPTHLAFGWGAHLCLGAPIARQVGATTLECFLDRVESIELEPGTAPVPYRSVQGAGFDELRVRLTPCFAR